MEIFVGREPELRASFEALASATDGAVHDIVGVHGIGKSTFLDRLGDEAEARGTRVFRIDMKRHGLGEGFYDDLGATASIAVLSETLDQSRQLMGRFAQRREREFNVFRQMARYQNQQISQWQAKNEIYIGRRSKVGQIDMSAGSTVTDEIKKHEIREAQRRIDDSFVEAWTEFTVRSRALITADTFESVADDEMGQWFVKLARRLPNTLVAIARTPVDNDPLRDTSALTRIYLPPWAPDEVARYLDLRMRHDRLQAGLAEIVHSFTDGHPGGVTLIADLIRERGGPTVTAHELRRILDRLPSNPNQRWAELIKLILDAVREPMLSEAVNATSLTTTFDAELLSELIGVSRASGTGVGDLIARLDGLRLLQTVKTLAGEPSGRFRVQEFIRSSVAVRLQMLEPAKCNEYHRIATQFYFRKLQIWDEDPYTSYGAWYRFEKPEWQECKREWLRHSGTLTERREITRARFTLVFLEAFWWWGYYLPFPFNRQLLETWNRAVARWERPRIALPLGIEQRPSEDEQLQDALTFLLNNYPVSHLKPAGALWDKLRDKLLLVKRLCGLRNGIPATASDEEKAEMRRLLAFISVFLAHTRRFNDPNDPKAEQYYQDALDRFGQMDDTWNVAWIHYERGDLAMERGALEQSLHRVAESARWVRVVAATGKDRFEWDHELLSNLHRLWADVHWLRGDHARAATGYGQALTHAYWFQGDPHAPDDYTQQFYAEITSRAAQRITQLGDRPSVAAAFASRMLGEFPGSLRTSVSVDDLRSRPDVETLCATLFRPGPAQSDLRYEDSAFMDAWSVVFEDVPDPEKSLARLEREASGGPVGEH